MVAIQSVTLNDAGGDAPDATLDACAPIDEVSLNLRLVAGVCATCLSCFGLTEARATW